MKKPILLIVDDEADIRELSATIILRFFDVELMKVGSIKEAKQVIVKKSPDYAFLDIQLSDGDGFELVSLLKQANKRVKFIFITAFNQMSEQQKAKSLGASGLIAKPFRSSDLKRALEEMMEK